jgi:hypothetical protein
MRYQEGPIVALAINMTTHWYEYTVAEWRPSDLAGLEKFWYDNSIEPGVSTFSACTSIGWQVHTCLLEGRGVSKCAKRPYFQGIKSN